MASPSMTAEQVLVVMCEAHEQLPLGLGARLDQAIVAVRAAFEELEGLRKRVIEPDMFWDDSDPEMAEESIDEIVDRYCVGDIVEIQAAYRLPNLLVRMIERTPDDEDYEVVAEGHEAIKAAREEEGK